MLIVSRNKRDKVMNVRPMSPGVGKYRPKWESVIPSPRFTIIHSQNKRNMSRRTYRKGRICKRLFRNMDKKEKKETLRDIKTVILNCGNSINSLILKRDYY